MDVGIITIHNHYNYGASLQAYALNNVVRQLGHRCQTVDCDIDPGARRRFFWSRHPGAQLTSLYNGLRTAANRRHERRFLDFIRQHIPLTSTTYASLEQLLEHPPFFDAYITGSDQVWRPSLLDRDIGPAFHLCFASPEKSRLISYAPSFGVSDIPDQYLNRVSEFLNRYHSLSAREVRGQELIAELTGRKAELVLDPTLLLTADDYEAILQPPLVKGKYLLVYPMELGKNLVFLQLVKKVKELTGLPVVCILPLQYDFRWLLMADRVVLDAGPSEFLGYFKNAAIACTNSFHGTAFSILYRKNFLGVPHSNSNSRLHSLLERVGLLDRQLAEVDSRTIANTLDRVIDYKIVLPKLQKHVDLSWEYLKKALAA